MIVFITKISGLNREGFGEKGIRGNSTKDTKRKKPREFYPELLVYYFLLWTMDY